MNPSGAQRIVHVGLGLLLAVLLSSAPTSAQGQTPDPAEPPVQDVADVASAVVQIIGQGAYRDVGDDEPFPTVEGTGFLISPSGLIVTNNHVVAGSRVVYVTVPGEARPHYATVVGLSECSDLALLDIWGDGYPYLQWYEGKVTEGMPVHSFGYADGKLRQTKGQIREVNLGADSNLASPAESILHTARVVPGNSGGPVTDATGQVIGINYARRGLLSKRSIMVSAQEAEWVLQRLLLEGKKESFGISGESWQKDERHGVWISAVQPDSPAYQAGLRPGDVLLRLEGQTLAEDETMTAYCDILQNWDGVRELPYEAMNVDSGELRIGQLRPAPKIPGTAQLAFVQEHAGDMTFLMPARWIDTAYSEDEENQEIQFDAAADLERAEEGIDASMLSLYIFTGELPDTLEPTELLDAFGVDEYCNTKERFSHLHMGRSTTYEGAYDLWRECGDDQTNIYSLVLKPQFAGPIIAAWFVSLTQEDDLAFDVFRNSIQLAPQATGAPNVRIIVAALNVRSGPGTGYPRMASLQEGEEVQILGRNRTCSWLKIALPAGDLGWISANPAYVTFTASCDELPVDASTPPPPTPTPIPTARPAPTPPEDTGELDPGLGCYLFENQLGVEVTVTFTRQGQPWNTTFKVPGHDSLLQCFEPGRYTYTIDAPPPWNSINGDLKVIAGDRYRFPIQGR